MSRKIVLGVAAAAGAAAFAFLVVVMVRKGLGQAGAWAGPLAALAGIVAAVAAVWAVAPARREVALPPELEAPGGVVDRPAELAAVVKALLVARADTVGITTGLYGAGGFGKTILARMACADRRVRRRFGGRVYLVTVGRDLRGAADIALKVNDVIKLVTGEDASFTDPQLAGQHLASALDAGPRRLLVLDDVWEPEQLAPFTLGGKQCVRLVTTRVPELLTGRGPAVLVDQMSEDQARRLLTDGLPPLDQAVEAGLLAVTGRWPLLLQLVNKILADYAQVAADVETSAAVLVERLAARGPAVVDEMLGEADRALDVAQPGQRERAVRATIEASTGLLNGDDAQRLAELSVFAEDEAVAFGLVTQLWRATAGLDELQAAQVCRRLAQLALISQTSIPAGGFAMHDVIRDFLRSELGQQRLAQLNSVLLDAVAAVLPAAVQPDGDECPVRVAWWQLGQHDRYLWDHLIEHLREAQRTDEAGATACDLRWVGARLEQFGPAAPAADLAVAGTPKASRLQALLLRTAHLLAPTEPARCVVDVLHSRVAEDPDWGPQVAALTDLCRRPRLVNRWHLPDLPDPALRRVLTGHTHDVEAVAVAPDGSWLASVGGQDGTVRIWDVATGQQRTVLTGHTDSVEAVAVAPDGSWLASGGDDEKVRIWDAATGQQRTVLTGHTDSVRALAVAPDGSWLASGGDDEKVRIWDAATGQQRAVLTGHTDSVEAVAVAPDGSWLASGGRDRTVRIWDVATGQQRAALTGHTGLVSAVAVAPDGSWVASVDRYGLDPAGGGGTLRIWDVSTAQQLAVLTGHTDAVRALTVAPDGTWLATGGDDGTVRIWDAVTGQQRAALTGHAWVWTVAVAPDGSWLASGGRDGTVRIWDAAGALERAMLTAHTGWLTGVAVAPDRSWLATGGRDGTVRIWDVATGQQRAVLAGHTGLVSAVAVAPDGSWLASADWQDGTVRIWDVATGQQRAVLADHTSSMDDDVAVTALAVAPDGSWLVSAGRDDGTVRIWDAATGQQRAVLTGHAGWVTSVTVAPDGSWLASSGYDGTVRVWDAATGQQRAVLSGKTRDVEAVAVAPDGSWLASAGRDDGTVRIWDAATGQQRTLLTGHGTWVHSVAVAPDGNWLASTGDDGTVRIWDAATWHTLAMMRTDGIAGSCAWLGSDALVLVGSAGLYLFGFLTETKSAPATTPLRALPHPATGNDVTHGE